MRSAESTTLRVLRCRARAPRVALILVAGVLCLLGLRELLTAPATVRQVVRSGARADDAAADGLAQLFARQFLSNGPVDDARAKRLADLGLPQDGLAEDRAGRAATRVEWTTVVNSSGSTRQREVTVAAGAGSEIAYLKVRVVRDRAARWRVASAPAVVGGPPAARATVPPAELEVGDASLKAAATRVVRHYLAGERDDLSADLTADASVTPPSTDFRVKAVQAVTWAQQPRRVAVEVIARSSSGRQLTLRYELPVVREGGRWLIAGVGDPTPSPEVLP